MFDKGSKTAGQKPSSAQDRDVLAGDAAEGVSGSAQGETPHPLRQTRSQLLVRSLYLDAQDSLLPEGGMPIGEFDRLSLLDRYALPPLSRMAAADQAELVEPLASLARMRAMGIDPDTFQFPEAHYRRIYNAVLDQLAPLAQRAPVDFAGGRASELNAFMRENPGCTVKVRSAQIAVDESIMVPSGVSLHGGGALLVRAQDTEVEKAILLDGVDGVEVAGFAIEHFRWPLFVKSSTNLAIRDNDIRLCAFKGIVFMGQNRCFHVAHNRLRRTGNGGMFFNGDISLGVVEDNIVEAAAGAGNFSGGMVLTALEIDDMDTAFNPWKQLDMAQLVDAPHDMVVMHNRITGCEANGVYSHAAYRVYFVGNAIEGNNKEGMCLDFGSCGCYVASNLFKRNGGRFNMTEELLAEDFISEHGMLPDGSSPAKVPGVSLDNAAYNILYHNVVAENYGSGIKMVRAGLRNVILCNEVSDNNLGESDTFHFFGIELGSDFKPDYLAEEVHELDFAPCFENIVARNTVSGAHYSGVFLGVDAYINDLFDNTVIGTPRAFEILSTKHNAVLNNLIIEVQS